MTISQRLGFIASRSRQTLYAGAAQATVQVLGLASGLLIVRVLPPEQYAYYTIALACVGTMNAIADGGIINGVFAQGGQVWGDRGLLGSVLATAARMRRRMTLMVVLPALPLIWLLLQYHGAGGLEAAAITLSVLPLFVVGMYTSLLEVVPKLHQNLRPLQINQLLANFLRALVLVLFVMVWPLALVGLLAPSVPQWWVSRRLRLIAAEHAEPAAPPDPQVRQRLVEHVRRTLPIAAYYAVSSQLTVWLLSIFGRTSSVAAIGALGRIAVVMTVLQTTFALLVVPRFARIPADRPQLVRRRYWQAQLLLAGACALPAGFVLLEPGLVLGILGKNYAGLERELQLVAIGASIATLTAAAFALGASRGVLAPPRLAIPVGVALQVALVLILPVETIAGVVWMATINAALEWVLYVGYFRYRQRIPA